MANIKSAIKRAGTNEKARLRNKAVRTHLKTSVKKFDAALATGDAKAAQDAFNYACKRYDQAAAKNVIHKNTANRKKAKLAQKLNALNA